MGAAGWAVVAACASAISAGASLFSIWFTRRGALNQARAADFGNCIEVVKQLADAQRKVRDAGDQTGEFEFRELMNLLEALAMLANDRKLAASTQRFTEHFLEEAWAWIRANEELRDVLNRSITGPETYAELLKFAKRRHSRIEPLTAAYSSATHDASGP